MAKYDPFQTVCRVSVLNNPRSRSLSGCHFCTCLLDIRPFCTRRNFYVAAGLDQVLDELASFRFSAQDINYLQTTKRFSTDFLAYLTQLRFSGQVYAMPEGTIFFADEPVMEVTAPLIEAQLLETFQQDP